MKKRKGFTLFELLVSISIIAILTALATVSYSIAQKKARDARRTQDMDAVRKAQELYYSQNNYVYASSADELTGGQFLEKFPSDPKSDRSYIENWEAPIDLRYEYCFCAELENENGGNATDSDCSMGPGNYYCVKNQQ